ncbi:MAG: GntR family transcriptional regulator [Arachnia sp.]
MQFNPSVPIWLQIVTECQQRIVAGTWSPGQRIPGVRDLAAELGVNPNTVQRALAELERDGLAYSERTSGRYVTNDHSQVEGLRKEIAAQAADDYVSRGRGVGLRLGEAQALLQERWKMHHPDDFAEPHEASHG